MILQGDVLEQLATLPDESVHCVVTSPPYWSLRDYQTEGQLGLEKTPEEYIEKMVAVFREVRRVLRKDGTLWLNMGDSYTSGGRATYGPSKPDKNIVLHNAKRASQPPGLKPKDLIGMPWRLALALQADGWWLRSDIIWAKPNPMPESVTDRPTSSHEHVFLLTKAARYFYDTEAVREKQITPMDTKAHQRFGAPGGKAEQVYGAKVSGDKWEPSGNRNLRDVWTIVTQPYPEAHFATFPEALVKRCILAGTSAKGCCRSCGAPWERVVKKSGGTTGKSWHDHGADLEQGISQNGAGTRIRQGYEADYNVQTTGWRPTCDHDGEPVPVTVLDPFGGSGTVGKVAQDLGREWVIIEINPDYCELARKRTANPQEVLRLG